MSWTLFAEVVANRSSSRSSSMSADTKIAELLTELHQLIKQTQEERSRTSPYYRTKLRGLYTTAKADAEAECSILRHALDKIADIKSLLEERRLAAKMAGVYSDSDPPRKTMRRGVLMTLLQQSAMTLPLWIGKPGESKDQLVLALYPQTTCFYRALIHTPPHRDDYSVLFEDTSYADGYSPPLNVAQRYVVTCKENKKK
ncbi:hypothetical protein CRUP_029413 [Coryphaenoides rupestris]|nr:hypothetical protein CRUP_029413 [Coryphaenoides rupestris]